MFGDANAQNSANANANANPFGAPTPPTPTTPGASPFAGSAPFGSAPFSNQNSGFGANAAAPGTFGASAFGGASAPGAFGTPGAFGGGTTSPFGVGSVSALRGASASAFGASAPTSASPFGAVATSGFGSSVNAPSVFGAQSATGGGFGAPVVANPFGASGSNTFAGASPFGAASPSPSSLFGAPPMSAAASAPTPFGSANISPFSAPAAASSPFGAPVVPAPSSPFGAPVASSLPFGAPPVASSSPFGAPSAVTSSPFGAPAPVSSPFGGSSTFGASAPSTSPTPFTPKMPERSPTSFGFGGAASPAPSTSGSPFGGGGLSSSATPFAPVMRASTTVASPSTPSAFGAFGAPKMNEEKGDVFPGGSAVGGGVTNTFIPPRPRQPVVDLTSLENTAQMPAPKTSPLKNKVNADGEITDVSSGYVVGTCDLMCPEKERSLRSANGDLEIFERPNADDRMTSHPELCVKKYTRIVDGITPDMVRTPKGLQLAIDQLWRILDGRDESFMTKSKFLWDRLRSIRQDLNLQQITDSFAVKLMEQMVRYTILSEHELCEEAASATNPDGHNSHLNVEQLTKTLTSLRHMYDDHADRDVKLSIDAEAEMFCYQLLLRIDSHGRYAVQRSEMLNDLRGVRPEVLKHKDVQFALECHRVYHSNNFAGFFRLVERATYLQACCLHKFFNSMRGKALEVMNATYSKVIVPVAEIARLLHTDDIEAEALLLHHGLTVSRGNDGDKSPALMIRESSFISPADEFPISRSELVDKKRASSYLLEIVGQVESARIMTKQLPSFSAAAAKLTLPAPNVSMPPPQTEVEKRKAQAEELRAKIAEREAALATERAAIEAKKKEIEERKEAEKKAAQEEERKAKEAEEAARKAEEAAKAAEAKARAEAEAAEAECKRIEAEAARAKAEAEARAVAEAERRRAEEEAERQRMEAERRAREAAEAARIAAIAKAEAEERARQAAIAEAERQRLIAEEKARREAAAAKAARRKEKMRLAMSRLLFSRWRMNSKEFRRERLINEALSMASPVPGSNMNAARALFDARASSSRPQDMLAQLRMKIEMSRSPEFGAPMDMPQTLGMALNEAAAMAAPSALVWKCLICTGAEADTGPKASSRPRTAAAMLAAEWLRTKLSRGASAHKVESDTGSILSLYGTRLPSLVSADEHEYIVGPLAWIIVRDVPAMMANAAGANAGASAAIFILDCGIGACEQHELDRLHTFYSAARGNEAPVAIMVATRDNCSEEAEREIRITIENAGVKGALVIFLNPKGPEVWTDEKLARALVFLAERAPRAPRRRIAHLAAEVEEALKPGYIDLTIKPRVSANACIAVFNNALDQVESRIFEAARSDDTKQWPPVEIGLVNAALPPPGWRSEEKRAKVLDAIRMAKLPPFGITDTPARAFIDYINTVLPSYPPEYGRCMLAQARYDPHFHKLENIPWIALFQSLITLLLNRLEGLTKGECIYLPPGHPSYTFTPYEPEPELLANVRSPDTPPHEEFASPTRKRKHADFIEETASERFEEIESAPLDSIRATMDALKRNIKAQSSRADASERWLAALATNTPGTLDVPDAYGGDVDVHLAQFNAQLAEERATEARLRNMLGSL